MRIQNIKLPAPDLIVSVLCFLYGTMLLVFVVSPGDGGWILYGKEMISGMKIYSDLQLNQQPLFPVLSAIVASITDVILYQHLLYLPILLLFCFSIYRLCAVVGTNVYFRSLLILCVFFFSIRFEAYRFDDYHVLAHSLVLLSAAISFEAIYNNRYVFNKFCIGQGLICVATMLVRINEGCVVLLGATCTLLFLSKDFRSGIRGILFFGTAILSFFAVIMLLIGESPLVWFDYTFARAAGNKGGVSLIGYPFRLTINSATTIRDVVSSLPAHLVLLSFLYLGAVYSIAVLTKKFSFLKCLLLAIFLCCVEYYLIKVKFSFGLLIVPLVVIGLLLIGNYVVMGLVFNRERISYKVIPVLAYSCSLFFMGALSSAGRYQDLTFPTAFSLATFPLLFNSIGFKINKSKLILSVFSTILLILVGESLYLRTKVPYAWHSYNVPPLFSSEYNVETDRSGVDFILSKQVSELIFPVCKIVSPGDTLLSLPFSFANYFCGIPVWHGYVQSFFDTSGPDLINRMLADLTDNPPNFIFYQRQISNMETHELLFNNGKPLAHRKIDKYIMEKVNSHEWEAVFTSKAFFPSEWLLIKTN